MEPSLPSLPRREAPGGLPPWQRTGHRLLQGLYLALALSGGALLAVPLAAPPHRDAYGAHLLAGVLFLPALGGFLAAHWRHTRGGAPPGPGALRWGLVLAGGAGICALTGVLLALGGAAPAGTRWLHAATGLLMVLPWMLHLAVSRGRSVTGLRSAAVVLAALAATTVPAWWRGKPDEILPPSPASALPASRDGSRLPPGMLVGERSCLPCHADIVQQWKESAHHHSSLNNPWHYATLRYAVEMRGEAAARICAACHSPALSFHFAGTAEEMLKLNKEGELGSAGINCLTCHAAVEIPPPHENGRYLLDSRLASGFPGRAPAHWLGQQHLRAYPEPHRQAMLKPLHGKPEFCATCHQVRLGSELTRDAPHREPGPYEQWSRSAYAGRVLRWWGDTPVQSCIDCHMPRVPARDPAARGGTVRSHRFPGINYWLAAYRGLDEQALQIERFLHARHLRLRVVGPLPLGSEDLPGGPDEDTITLAVLVSNRGVGHAFPTGSVDLNEIWLDVRVRDRRGETIYESGVFDPERGPDEGAHRYGALYLDAHSNPIDKHNLWAARRVAFLRLIPPEGVDVVRYRFPRPPPAAFPLKVEARLLHRKFATFLHTFSFGAEPLPGAYGVDFDDRSWRPSGVTAHLPTLVLAEHRVDLPAPLTAESLLDYATGLFQEGEFSGAAGMFRKAARRNPHSLDAWMGLSRAALRAGDLEEARRSLKEARRLDPSDPRGILLEGLLAKGEGRSREALSHLLEVERRYADDPAVLEALADLLEASGRPAEAAARRSRREELRPETEGPPRADPDREPYLVAHPGLAREARPRHLHDGR